MMTPNRIVHPIFIFGQPRSGSTLMQRLLNSTGKTFIYGEHVGFLKGLADSYFALFKHHSVVSNPVANNYFRRRNRPDLLKPFDFSVATHTGFSYEGMRRNYRLFVENSINSHRFSGRWGFKEIHYGIHDDTFYFLRELFRHARFVFIVRNPVYQISSKMVLGWWPDDSFDDSVEIWRLQAVNFRKYALEFPQYCQFVRYEDFSNNPTIAESVLAKLELRFGRRQRHVLTGRKVGACNRAYSLSEAQRDAILSQCSGTGVYSIDELEAACAHIDQREIK